MSHSNNVFQMITVDRVKARKLFDTTTEGTEDVMSDVLGRRPLQYFWHLEDVIEYRNGLAVSLL